MPLTLLDLSKRFVGPDGSSVPVIDIASLRIEDGEQVALIGPTGALDPGNARQVLQLIRGLCREANAALLLVTHDLEIAGQLPRRLVLSELNRASTAAASATLSPSPGTPGEGWGGGSGEQLAKTPALTLPRNTGGGN